MHLSLHTPGQPIPDTVLGIYREAFPPEERRSEQSLQELVGSRQISLYLILSDEGEVQGFITSWTFDTFRYVEHFAVDPAQRSGGIGSRALDEYISISKLPVVLEVEPPSDSPLAERRLRFYQRHKFNVIDTGYIQPPYATGLPALNLYLLAAIPPGYTSSSLTPAEISAVLHSHVYKVT